jgi:hypothetical protein
LFRRQHDIDLRGIFSLELPQVAFAIVGHLAKHVGRPVIWNLADFAGNPRYVCFLGAKRPLRRRAGA